MLGLTPATLRRMRAQGLISEVRPTGQRAVRVRESDVRALIARGEPLEPQTQPAA